MDIFEKIKQFIDKHKLIKPNQTIILGLSGGPDSIFLFHFLLWLKRKMPLTFIVAHLDHEWRKGSDNDLTFCAKVCLKHNIPFIGARASTLPCKMIKRGSKEDEGRQLRRFFFGMVKEKYQADAIALAQQSDDQIETFFIRLLRGATVTGLSCMWPMHDGYIRPLLNMSKKEILNYLKRNGIKYLTDPTNVSPKFLRNRIRLELIPMLTQIDHRAESNTLKTINNIQEAEHFIEEQSKKIFTEVSKDGELQKLNLTQFFNLEPFMQNRVLLLWLYQSHAPFTISTGIINEIMRFFKNTKSRTHAIDSWVIKKQKNYAFILKKS